MEKPLVWKHGEIKTPPFSLEARVEAGFLLRRLQKGENLSLPHSRPMPSIGSTCHELRIVDRHETWRVIYAVEVEAIVVLEVFKKKTQRAPKHILVSCKNRLEEYRRLVGEKE